MTAIQVIAEVRAAGGRLTLHGDKLRWRLPVEPPARLVEAIRERKPDLLMLLRFPATACPACDGNRFRPDSVGLWRCEHCQPESPPDPFGPLPAGEEDALAELELRSKLREPEYARLTLSQPVVSGSVRVCQIVAASVVWVACGPEAIARSHAQAWEGIPPALIAGRRIRYLSAPGEPALGEWLRTPKGTACEVLAFDADSGEALSRTLAGPRWQWSAAGELTSEMDWDRRPK